MTGRGCRGTRRGAQEPDAASTSYAQGLNTNHCPSALSGAVCSRPGRRRGWSCGARQIRVVTRARALGLGPGLGGRLSPGGHGGFAGEAEPALTRPATRTCSPTPSTSPCAPPWPRPRRPAWPSCMPRHCRGDPEQLLRQPADGHQAGDHPPRAGRADAAARTWLPGPAWPGLAQAGASPSPGPAAAWGSITVSVLRLPLCPALPSRPIG